MIDKELAVKVAEKAAEIVEAGWTQGDAENNGSYCAVGALHKAETEICGKPLGLLGAYPKVRDVSEAYIRNVLGWKERDNSLAPLADWNDAPERTQAEVADMWRHVAKEISNG